MSWLDRIQTELVITTGDGRQYRPQWLKATKSKEYNIAEFDFPEKSGTLVRRGKPRGRRYDLEVYFQGEDHLDLAEAFEISADDERPWVISHPYYGRLVVQPIGLFFDNAVQNISKITGTVVETITDENPRVSFDAKEKILIDIDALKLTFTNSFATRVPVITTEMNRQITDHNISTYGVVKKNIKSRVDAENYFNLFRSANATLTNATADPIAVMSAIQAMISAPFLFEDSAQNRIAMLVNQFDFLRVSINTITTPAQKVEFESTAGMTVASMAAASATYRDGDYGNRNDVYSSIEKILNAYNTFLSDLDSFQTDNNGEPDSYIPGYNTLSELNALIDFTVSNLFSIAINSKQERTIYLQEDTNVVNLAHRIYGLSQDDKTIEDLMRNNSIGLSELLGLRKGRKIVYYI